MADKEKGVETDLEKSVANAIERNLRMAEMKVKKPDDTFVVKEDARDIPVGSDTDGDDVRSPSTYVSCIDEDVEATRKRIDEMRKKRRWENAAMGLELLLVGTALCASFYVLGKAVGIKAGYVRGYNDGLVSGERNILTEYVRNRVWEAV